MLQALSLPGEEAVRDCLEEREEVEGEALRRAQEACREGGEEEVEGEGIEQGQEVDRKDLVHSDEEETSLEEDEKSKVSEYDVLDYEYSDNCSTFYDGR